VFHQELEDPFLPPHMASALSSFRNLEEYQRSVRQAGHRVYHHLTDIQKTELKQMILEEMNRVPPLGLTSSDEKIADDDKNNTSWRSSLQRTTQELIRTKNEQGETVDANALVEEVLPIAHASIPVALRQKLFSKIFEMTNAGSCS
jgi:hypothetical protein